MLSPGVTQKIRPGLEVCPRMKRPGDSLKSLADLHTAGVQLSESESVQMSAPLQEVKEIISLKKKHEMVKAGPGAQSQGK